jgi:hypothetical protein
LHVPVDIVVIDAMSDSSGSFEEVLRVPSQSTQMPSTRETFPTGSSQSTPGEIDLIENALERIKCKKGTTYWKVDKDNGQGVDICRAAIRVRFIVHQKCD